MVDFLIVPSKGLYGCGGGGGRSRAIKFLYAPKRPEQGDKVPSFSCSLTPHSMGPETSLVGSSPPWSFSGYVYSHIGMLVCTHIMVVCTRRPLQGGLFYIKPPMHLWFIRPSAKCFWCGQHPLLGQVGGGWALGLKNTWTSHIAYKSVIYLLGQSRWTSKYSLVHGAWQRFSVILSLVLCDAVHLGKT